MKRITTRTVSMKAMIAALAACGLVTIWSAAISADERCTYGGLSYSEGATIKQGDGYERTCVIVRDHSYHDPQDDRAAWGHDRYAGGKSEDGYSGRRYYTEEEMQDAQDVLDMLHESNQPIISYGVE